MAKFESYKVELGRQRTREILEVVNRYYNNQKTLNLTTLTRELNESIQYISVKIKRLEATNKVKVYRKGKEMFILPLK